MQKKTDRKSEPRGKNSIAEKEELLFYNQETRHCQSGLRGHTRREEEKGKRRSRLQKKKLFDKIDENQLHCACTRRAS